MTREADELRREIQEIRAEIRARQEEERRRRELAPSPPVRVPARDPVAQQLEDAVSRALGPVPTEREPRIRAVGDVLRGPPPTPPTRWWLDPREQREIKARADEITAAAGRPSLGIPGPPPSARRPVIPRGVEMVEEGFPIRERLEPRERVPEFDPYAPGFMGVTTPAGKPLSWAEMMALRASGVSALETGKGVLDLTTMTRPIEPHTVEELRALGQMPIELRPEPGSPEYTALGQKHLIDRLRSHFAPPALGMEEGRYWEEVVRPSGVIEVVGGGSWTHQLRDAEAQERVALMVSPRAFWRYAKAGRLRNVLGAGEALADVAVTVLAQTAYWVERSIGEFMLRNMVEPEQFAREQQRVAQTREMFPELPGRREERERTATEYADLYNVLYDPSVSEAARTRTIAEVARIAYSPLPNQTKAAQRILSGEDPDTVVWEEMDPVSELLGQLVLDPVNWLAGPAIGRVWKGAAAARNAKFWLGSRATDPDALRFIGLTSKWTKKGARFGLIPEALDPFALTRGARQSLAGDAAAGLLNRLAWRYADEPEKLLAALKGLDADWNNVARLAVGVEPTSEGSRLARAMLSGVIDPESIGKWESLAEVGKPIQLTLGGVEEAPKVFNVAEFMDEATAKIYSHAEKAFNAELDQYAKWNIPGRVAQASRGALSQVYLGANPGWLGRNTYNNFSTIAWDDVTTFRSVGKLGDEFAEAWGLEKVPGFERGFGVTEETGARHLLLRPGAWVEKKAGGLVIRHQTEQWYTRLWQAADAPYFPGRLKEYLPGASDEMIDWMQRVAKDSLNPQQFKAQVDDVFTRIRRGPIAGAAPEGVPPVKAPPTLDELQRRVQQIDDEIVRIADEAGFSSEQVAAARRVPYPEMEFPGGVGFEDENFKAIANLSSERRSLLQTAVPEARAAAGRRGPTLDELAAQARQAEGGGQAEMFAEGQDLPLFSETPMYGEMPGYAPPEEAGRAVRLPGMECPVCMGEGVFGGKRCLCGGTGLREVAEETLERAAQPRYSYSVGQLDPEGRIPHNVKAEAQSIVDELIENGDDYAFDDSMIALRAENGMRTRWAELRDSLFYHKPTGGLVLGSTVEGLDDLADPLHFFPRGTIRSIEKTAGVDKKAAQRLYAWAIEEVSGRPPAIPVSQLSYSSLGDEEKIRYVQRVLADYVERGGKLDDFLDGKQAKALQAYLDQNPDDLLLYVRSPADFAPGPMSEDELLRAVPEFRNTLKSGNQKFVDNDRIAKMMGYEGDDRLQRAQQLAVEAYKYGAVGAAESRSGLRAVLVKVSGDVGATAEDFLQVKIKGLESWIEPRWAPRLESHGGRLAESDVLMLRLHKEKLAFLKGEADDIPILRELVSPMTAQSMSLRDAEEVVAFVDRVKAEFVDAGELIAMADDELVSYADEISGKLTEAEKWRKYWDEVAEEALPEDDIAKAFWNIKDQIPMESLPGKKRITLGRKPRQIVEEGPDGQKIVRYTKGTRSEIPEFRWDEWVANQEAKHPGFYQGVRDDLARGSGRTEVGDADVFMKAVDMRRRKTAYRGKYVGQEDALKSQLDVVGREMKRRGFEEQWDAAWRESIEEMRRRGEISEDVAAKALGEVVEADEGKEIFVRQIRDRLASGEMKPEDLDELIEMEWLSAEEVDELKQFHQRHWALQDEQNSILAKEIAERERRALEGRVLGPEVQARPASPPADWTRISKREAAGTGVYGREIMENRIEARGLGEFFRAPKGTPVPEDFELLRTGATYDYVGRKVAPVGEPGLGRAFAAREAVESGPSTWGGSRVADAYRAQEACVDDFIWRVMQDAPGGVRKPPVPPGEFTDEAYDAIMKWADEVADPSREGVKLVCETNAVQMRDFALLDYRNRRNFDLWLAMVMPYHYWYTRTGWNWLQRMATKPVAFNMQTRLQTSLRQANSELPGRLRDTIGVPAPILKEWMGDKAYIDPARNVFAHLNVYPWAGISDFDYDDPVEARNAFQEWGDLFERVQGRMFFYYDLPLRWISGEGSEVYYQAPLTAGVKGTSALLREAGVLADTGETLFIPPGGWNIEAQPREWLGLPRAYFTEEEYWPVQHLAMMAALGEITEDEGWDAVYEAVHLGKTDHELWQEAYQRGAVQRGVSQFGSFWLGQPVNIYPKGEEILRKWSAELDKLGYIPGERERGTAEERFRYIEEHAGMSLRSLGWAMMPPKAWMFKDESGVTDVEAYLEERRGWERAGGRLGALERKYKLREYGKEREAVDVRWARIQNELIKDGMVPGTRAYRIVDQWYREEIFDPLYERYNEYFTGGAEEPDYRASPKEREEWYKQRRAKALADEYYSVEPERFQDKQGNTDWDAFYAARQAALDALEPEVRFEVEQYLYRNWIPEEEAMRILEAAVYAPLADLIGGLGELEGEERKAAQAEVDALKAGASVAAARAIADAEVSIRELHPDWGDAEVDRFLNAEIAGFETWQRRAMDPRRAFQHAFEQFYWSLDAGTRRTLRDQQRAKMGGLSGNYLGKEFEQWEEKNHKLEGLSDVPDVLLLDWLAKTGQIAQLEAEGFRVPGRPLADVLATVPGYEYRARGEEVPFEGVVGRAGGRIGGKVSGELPVPPRPPRTEFDTETERIRQSMREAAADVAVEGEERSEIELADPTFEMPEQEVINEWARLRELQDGYYALPEGEARREYLDQHPELRELWDKWVGPDNSPKALWWNLYFGRDTGIDWSAGGAENNPAGWNLLPRELKDNPFVEMVFESMDTDVAPSDEVFIEARLAIEEYVEEHREELMQAREEYIAYLGLLSTQLEDLQDQYYELPERSQERRDFVAAHPELDQYWEVKRQYKDQHPVMVKYYFPPREEQVAYQPRGTYTGWAGRGWGGRGRGAAPTRGADWDEFSKVAGPELVEVLTAYWTGRGQLSDAARGYLQALYSAHAYGAASFEEWMDLLYQAWQATLPRAGAYEIPMRQRGVIISPQRRETTGFGAPGRPPTRVRYLRT